MIAFGSKSILIITVLGLALSLTAQAAAGNFTTAKKNRTSIRNSTIPEVLIHREVKPHDGSFAISPSAVLNKLKQTQKITLIDIRSRGEFEILHIPGSLNLPLHAVKTKFFLKSVPIVLINDGFYYRPLRRECRQLDELGFKVSILDGGLAAWRRKGNRLVGDRFAMEDMQTISPRKFLSGKNSANTLAINISPVQSEIARQLLPHSNHIPISVEPDRWLQEFNTSIADYKKQPYWSVVVFSETGNGYGRVEKLLAGLNVNAFYLQDGVVGYEKYLEDLILSWQPQNSRIKTNRKCRSCCQKIEGKIMREVRE